MPSRNVARPLGFAAVGIINGRKPNRLLRDREEAELVKQIRRVFAANKGRYGSPRVSQALRQDGIECGENRVARLICVKMNWRRVASSPSDRARQCLEMALCPI